MEINPIASGSSARFNVVEQAQRTAIEQRLDFAQKNDVAVGRASPTVTTSSTFSPALYAQAAQFQIYSQSGALMHLLGAHGLSPPKAERMPDSTEKVLAVDSSAKGARLDTRA